MDLRTPSFIQTACTSLSASFGNCTIGPSHLKDALEATSKPQDCEMLWSALIALTSRFATLCNSGWCEVKNVVHIMVWLLVRSRLWNETCLQSVGQMSYLSFFAGSCQNTERVSENSLLVRYGSVQHKLCQYQQLDVCRVNWLRHLLGQSRAIVDKLIAEQSCFAAQSSEGALSRRRLVSNLFQCAAVDTTPATAADGSRVVAGHLIERRTRQLAVEQLTRQRVQDEAKFLHWAEGLLTTDSCKVQAYNCGVSETSPRQPAASFEIESEERQRQQLDLQVWRGVGTLGALDERVTRLLVDAALSSREVHTADRRAQSELAAEGLSWADLDHQFDQSERAAPAPAPAATTKDQSSDPFPHNHVTNHVILDSIVDLPLFTDCDSAIKKHLRLQWRGGSEDVVPLGGLRAQHREILVKTARIANKFSPYNIAFHK